MATDLEKFVEQEGRDEKIKQVRAMIDEKGIEYLYLQFVSVTGKIMGKGIPADHWETVAKKGFQLVYGATVNLFLNRAGEYLGYGPEAASLSVFLSLKLSCSCRGHRKSVVSTAPFSETVRRKKIQVVI